MRNGCVISLVRETHVTDVTEASSWFSASGLLTVSNSWYRSLLQPFTIFCFQLLSSLKPASLCLLFSKMNSKQEYRPKLSFYYQQDS